MVIDRLIEGFWVLELCHFCFKAEAKRDQFTYFWSSLKVSVDQILDTASQKRCTEDEFPLSGIYFWVNIQTLTVHIRQTGLRETIFCLCRGIRSVTHKLCDGLSTSCVFPSYANQNYTHRNSLSDVCSSICALPSELHKGAVKLKPE